MGRQNSVLTYSEITRDRFYRQNSGHSSEVAESIADETGGAGIYSVSEDNTSEQ